MGLTPIVSCTRCAPGVAGGRAGISPRPPRTTAVMFKARSKLPPSAWGGGQAIAVWSGVGWN
eukprot:5024848-Lingulodinium_polyedra.AAC.1